MDQDVTAGRPTCWLNGGGCIEPDYCEQRGPRLGRCAKNDTQAVPVNADQSVFIHAMSEQMRNFQRALNSVWPMVPADDCNCGLHTRGALTAGWLCKLHGQQF